MMQWLSKLLPKQKMQGLGDGNVQAGRVEGDLNHTQSSTTQHIYNTIYVVSGQSTPAEAVPVKEEPQPPAPALASRSAEPTQPQRDLLRLMGQNSAYEPVVESFMRREFGSDRVKRLSTFECTRTTRYLEACIKRDAAKSEANRATNVA